ncbi:Tim44/TimA family putative adaptor protein [Pelagibacteraceae bacterium]|nr:Tim44/TimA family putative adaptor protein [Pelagibacteraceae bacterium]
MYIDIILFAILAAVLATNLYKILGKKTISEDVTSSKKNMNIKEDKNIFSNEVMDYSQKQILNLDKDFSFPVFLDGAKSAFNLIVNAYKNKKIQEVKDLLNSEVYDNFKKSISKINDKEEETKSFQIISLKAAIVNIEVIEKLVKIKVEFSSLQETIFKNDNNNNMEVTDIWIFEREMDSKSLMWKLIEVSSK